MRAVFIIFLLVTVFAVAMAGVHHYKIPGSNTETVHSHKKGDTIFDTAASLINGVI